MIKTTSFTGLGKKVIHVCILAFLYQDGNIWRVWLQTYSTTIIFSINTSH